MLFLKKCANLQNAFFLFKSLLYKVIFYESIVYCKNPYKLKD